MTAEPHPILKVVDLQVHFPILRGVLQRKVGSVKAVDGVTFDVRRGETLGVVGESGSGKTTLGRAILKLVQPTAGQVFFEGEDLCRLNEKTVRQKRRHLQMIFQDPYSSLNPRVRAIATPGRSPPVSTAKLNASSRPHCVSGPTPEPATPPLSAPNASCPGSSATMGIGPVPVSRPSHPAADSA
jgi:ABC-type oligopeptide transport system ATPase subunit